jgi:hypothetical protein
MRYRKIALTAAAAGLMAVGLAAPSQAALTTYCDGTAADVTVPGDLIVAAGKSCELTNVTINGNVTVRADANLLLDGSTVNGNVRLVTNAFADVVGTSVTGVTTQTGGYGIYAEDSDLVGNVAATDSGFFYSVGTTHARLTSTNGETFVESGWVKTNLTTTGDTLTDVYDTVVQGALSVTGAEQGGVLCLSEVDGAATFSGNGEILQIGASAPLTGCGYNAFHNNLTVSDNSADVYVSDNVIRGNFVLSGNTGAVVAENNRVRGEDGSAAAAAAKSSLRSDAPSTAAVDRKAQAKADAEARAEAASDKAEAAGPAFS